MDCCPYCGRDLRSAQQEAVERLLRGLEHNPELLSLIRRVANATCVKATPYETYMLLKETAALPRSVIECALDIFKEKTDTRGRAYSSEYFRVLLHRLNDEYQTNQVSIPYIGGTNESKSRDSCPRSMSVGGEDT